MPKVMEELLMSIHPNIPNMIPGVGHEQLSRKMPLCALVRRAHPFLKFSKKPTQIGTPSLPDGFFLTLSGTPGPIPDQFILQSTDFKCPGVFQRRTLRSDLLVVTIEPSCLLLVAEG